MKDQFTKIKVGEKITKRNQPGFYSDEMECANDVNHKVLWWYEGLFCLQEKKYVDSYIVRHY